MIFSELRESRMGYMNSLRASEDSKLYVARSLSHDSERTRTIDRNPPQDAFQNPEPPQNLAFLENEDQIEQDQNLRLESDTTDVETIGVISVNGSVIHYSLGPSAADLQQQIFTPTVIGDNGRLTLRLLNVYLALFITDTSFAQDLEHTESADEWIRKKASPQILINDITGSVGKLVDVIGFVDQIIQTLSSFLCNDAFQEKCHVEAWGIEDISTFERQISSILRSFILEYAPQAKLSAMCPQFEKSVSLLKSLGTETCYWKQTRTSNSHEVDDEPDWIMDKMRKLRCVPPTIVESLNFDVAMPANATPYARSRKGEIELLEIFTSLYAIFLTEIKKLFQSVLSVSRTTGILRNLDISLLVESLEGFLRNSFISGTSQLLVDLDKLVLVWAQDNEFFKENTKAWASRFIANWNTDKNTGGLGSTATVSTTNSCEATSPEFDLVRLFINEVLDICALGTCRRSEPLETLTMREKAPTSGLGWLTIFQEGDDGEQAHEDHANAITCEINSSEDEVTDEFRQLQALYGGEFSMMEDETTMNVIPESEHFWSRHKTHHHKPGQFRNWIKRGLRPQDVVQKHRIVEKCHRAKEKLKGFAHKVSHKEQGPTLLSAWHKTAANQHAPASTRPAYCFEEAFDRTTYGATFHEQQIPRRYENLRRKKDRFMFLFFGEEK
ncbi:LAFA_0A01728g1_1 [Lachancea sp. 'fantastica']|nr:LAFA_0A01728g1_1 [Lachancea sp. 'fantastica']